MNPDSPLLPSNQRQKDSSAAEHTFGEEVKRLGLQPHYAVEVFTGIRPTGALTIANYVGAVQPTLGLLESGLRPVVFVADLHGMTTHEPAQLVDYTREVIIDYIALGMDPAKADIFVQSAISTEVFELTSYLARHISVAELLRVPTLKDKVGQSEREVNASAFLLMYPVMMAADILLQRARFVPVGEDQMSHLELTRKIGDRFNQRYGPVFPEPQAIQMREGARILGLQGSGKMGKSHPNEALFLTDSADTVAAKVRGAKTAMAGEGSDVLSSHVALVKAISDETTKKEVDDLLARHLNGEKILGSFKKIMTERVNDFLGKFQARRAELVQNRDYVDEVVERGNERARVVARETMSLVRRTLRPD